MRVTIDRFEGDFAVVEAEGEIFANLPIALVPDGAREGSVIEITLNDEETKKRKKDAESLMNRLFRD